MLLVVAGVLVKILQNRMGFQFMEHKEDPPQLNMMIKRSYLNTSYNFDYWGSNERGIGSHH